jgi:alkyldihydroxyacetonephosphate synthase
MKMADVDGDDGNGEKLKDDLGGPALSAVSNRRLQLKWNGWGYQDSKFIINKNGHVEFIGGRYGISGHVLSSFRSWMVQALNIDLNFRTPPQKKLAPADYPRPVRCDAFLSALSETPIAWSIDGEDRLYRAHGHTLAEINTLRTGKFDRIPGSCKCLID